ncbi:hypothetical protein [Levilactobacillus senmaizukei]|nr:hypothetical protein [Levilactobacillus senmaizukei]
MKRLVVKLGLVGLALGTFGGVLSPTVASAKSKPTFTKTDLKRYYKSAKSKSAFYFKTVKSGKKTGTILILGDFNGTSANVKYGVPSSMKISKNGRTLTTKYKLMQFKTKNGKTTTSLGKTNYTFKLTKKSASKFSTKLSGNKTNRRLATSGKTYTYSKVKASPAGSYSKKYVKPAMVKQQTKKYEGIGLADAQVKKIATTYATTLSNTMVKNFNYKN